MKMIYYKLVKTTIDAADLTKFIINVIVRHLAPPKLIIINRGSLFTSKFWSSLCYFLSIKQKLSITFYPQIDGQTKRQNSILETSLRVFLTCEQNNWVRLLLMVKFVYNNAKSASTGHMPFKLNYGYHPRMFFEDEVDLYSRFCSANKPAKKLTELILIYQQNLLYALEVQ